MKFILLMISCMIMVMQIIEFNETEKDKYNETVKNELLQKWEWGDFKKQYGWEVKRIGILDSEKIIYSSQILIKRLPFSLSFLYAPSVIIPKKEIFELFLEKTKNIAKENNSIFFLVEANKENGIKAFGFRKTSEDIQPKDTLVLDLNKTEREILGQMKPKGRYNVKIALKRGVLVKEINSEKDFLDYKEIHEETSKRDKISARSFDYLKSLFVTLKKNNLGTCLIAYYKNKPIAGGIFSFADKKATYMYGASSNENRNIMAPYLVQWTAIKKARKRNCTVYDFYGIASEETKNHKWQGISNFKRKFGGKEITNSGSYFLAFRPFLYMLFMLIKKIRKLFI